MKSVLAPRRSNTAWQMRGWGIAVPWLEDRGLYSRPGEPEMAYVSPHQNVAWVGNLGASVEERNGDSHCAQSEYVPLMS